MGLGGPSKIAADRPAGADTASAGPAAAVDKVSLTGDALRMQQLVKTATSGPVVDSARVNAAKAAIAGGRYKIDSRSVAAKMQRFEWEMKQ